MKTKAYVGSAWYANCEPFLTVVINPAKYGSQYAAYEKLGDLADGYAKEDYERADWGETEDEFMDSVRLSGVFLEEVEISETLLPEFEEQGYVYLD